MGDAKIVVVGSSNTDLIVQADHIPAPGETVLGGDLKTVAGGKGANQAVAAARLGASVALVARVGADHFGQEALRAFKQEGLDCEHVARDPGHPSGAALIIVERGGQNAIAVAPGANSELCPEDVDSARPAIEEADVLLLQLEVPLRTVRRAAELASQAGIRVILNPAPARKLDDELLELVSVLTPNESEAELLTGVPVEDASTAHQAAQALRASGAETVIVTMGAAGAYLLGEDDAELIPSPAVEAVDATAAGDAFNGALACALAAGRSFPQAVEQANQAAALSVTRLGAQPSLPTLAELENSQKAHKDP